MKITKLFIPILLLLSLFTGFTPNQTVEAIIIAPGTYFSIGYTNYTVNVPIDFSQIIINASNITFNHNNFQFRQIPSVSKVNISFTSLIANPLVAVSGNLIVDFIRQTAAIPITVWYNMTGLKPAYVYRYNVDGGAAWTYVTTNASGGIAFNSTLLGLHTYKLYDYGIGLDITPPVITINFAGNHSEKGGPYWRPPGETPALTGANLNGYYTNDSYQNESWIYINLTVTDATTVDKVKLHWHNETTNKWFNTSGFVKKGSYHEINTSINITNITTGHKYSFDVWANDTTNNIADVWWNKTKLGGGYTRRYVHLLNTPSNITYTPLYLYSTTYALGDYGKVDRLIRDQGIKCPPGPTGGINDLGFAIKTTPTDIVQRINNSAYLGFWYNDPSCNLPIILNNLYCHIWWNGATTIPYFYNTSSFFPNYVSSMNHTTMTSAEKHSSITYTFGGTPTTFNLGTTIIKDPVAPHMFTDNDIYTLALGFNGNNKVIDNRSFTSFVLLNVPSNATLNASHPDTDSDGLTDWEELYQSYTNPFLADTDDDGQTDDYEYFFGSDPNDYTDIYVPPIPGALDVDTNASTNVEETTATLNGFLVDDGGGGTGELTYSIFSPNGVGDITGLKVYGALNNWQAVDEYPSPNDGDVVVPGYLGTSYKYDSYNIQNHDIYDTGIINGVNITFRGFKETTGGASAYAKPFLWFGAAPGYYGTETTLTTTPTNYYYTWSTNPSTGLVWTWADIDSLQIGIGLKHTGATVDYFAQCSQIYLTVSHNELNGSDVCFQYGNTMAYGTETTEQHKYSGDSFYADLISLLQGSLYHFRAKAVNTNGTSYGSDLTFLTKPEAPSTYAITNTGNSTQTHTWTKGTGANNTVIRVSNDTYPTTPQSNQSFYNGTASTKTNNSVAIGLYPGLPHYYRLWSYSPWGTGHQFSDNYDQEVKLTQPYAPPDHNANLTSPTTVNLSWVKGGGANGTTIRKSTTGFPTHYTDGTLAYAGTGNYTTVIIASGGTYYFTAFSYTTWGGLTTTYSHNGTYFTNITGGGFIINSYDETDYTNLTFNVLITNKDGTDTYFKTNCTNPEIINASLCPNGADILILVSAEGHNQRQYMADIYPGVFYVLNAYLPTKYENTTVDCVLRTHTDSMTITNPGVDAVTNLTHPLDSIISVQIYNSSLYGTYGGWYLVPDDKYNLTVLNVTISNTVIDDNTTEAKVEYYYWYCGLTSSSFIYQLTVYNRYYQPLQAVRLDVKKYINTTGTFDAISTIMTDAAGQTDIFLIPGTLYFFTLSKTGFITNTSYWVPTNALFTHIFIMDYIVANETEPTDPFDYITFNANFSISNTTLSIRVLDISGFLTNATIYIYENTTLIYTVNLTGTPWILDYTNNVSSPNITRHSYSIHLYVRHHASFGYYNFTITINQLSSRHGLLLGLDIDLVALLGEPGGSYGHIGWVNIFILAIGLFFILSFGRYWSGISLIGFGLLIAIIEILFGLPGLTALQILCFICFAIVYGILVELGKAKEGKVY